MEKTCFIKNRSEILIKNSDFKTLCRNQNSIKYFEQLSFVDIKISERSLY